MSYYNCDLRDIQIESLKILLDIKEVFEKNNLTYWIESGTLLGAVRHNGFIPWDDDIDIAMPVKDYKRFCKIAQKQLKEGYFLQNYKTERCFDLQFTKIRKDNTTAMPIERKRLPIHQGLGIDIFAVIGLRSGFQRKIQQKLVNINAELVRANSNPYLNIKMSLRNRIVGAIPRFIRIMIIDLNNLYIFKNPKKSQNLALFCGSLYPWGKRGDCQETVFLEFEGYQLPAPSGYDNILKTMYGDYMMPPPLDKRMGHELTLGEMIYDIKNDYRFYTRET